MTLNSILNNLTAGSICSVIVLILSLIEITPIKLSPLKWIGKRVNEEITKDFKTLTERVDDIDNKLNAHMVESYRTSILDFADKVMLGQKFTHDKWRQVLKVCGAYERMIEEEHLVNGDATEAIEYIHSQYQICCASGDFNNFGKYK